SSAGAPAGAESARGGWANVIPAAAVTRRPPAMAIARLLLLERIDPLSLSNDAGPRARRSLSIGERGTRHMVRRRTEAAAREAARRRSDDRERLLLALGQALLEVVDVAATALEALVGQDP